MNTKENKMSEAINQLFNQRDKYIVIGLTGRTGSGCSTAASVLEKNFHDINIHPPYNPLNNNEERKYNIFYEWAMEKWKKFTRINAGSVIAMYICKSSSDEVSEVFGENFDCEALGFRMEFYKNIFDKYSLDEIDDLSGSQLKKFYRLYFHFLPKISLALKKNASKKGLSSYTEIMQKIGDNIRASGGIANSDYDAKNVYNIPYSINRMIKLARKYNKEFGGADYFVVDAIRHPYEVEFFRRYSAFYLIAITTKEESRIRRLHYLNYTDREIKDLSKKEYPEENALEKSEILVSQNIGKCLELADIIVENPDDEHRSDRAMLKESMVKYISLIQHPGIISPNRIERCMQVAITAKLNSGCISRQVGAVVADNSYSIRSIGWNSAPEGQVPCNLRNVKRLMDESDCDSFSDFERDLSDEKFKTVFSNLPHFNKGGYSVEGRPLCYCFKSTYNKAKNEKNQVHTRALHAEENAFLQLTKYGSQSIRGGILFTTASPCELCSKKAYQLGIGEIFYIDPYPGIANQHILSYGKARPQLRLYTGAVGRAYVQLYQPLVPLKDELDVLMGK